jgi:hypothetical protein
MDKSEYSKTDEKIEMLKEQLASRERRRRKAELQIAFVAATMSGAGFVVALTQILGAPKTNFGHVPATIINPETIALRAKVDDIQRQYEALNKAIYTKPPQINSTEEQQRFLSSVASLDDRMTKIEDAISATPDKALAVPLLRNDVEAISKRLEDYRASDRAEIDRLYDQQKWMLGGIGTVLFAIAGAAVTFIFKVLTAPGKRED